MSDQDFPRTADTVIIGGGCIGVSIAYHLTRSGIRNVVLLERSALASGPTGRSSAQLIPRSEHPIVAKLKWEGLEFYRDFESRTGKPVDFRSSGYLAVAPEDQAHSLDADLRQLASLGSRAARIDVAGLKEMAHSIRLDNDEVALAIPEAGYVDPTAAVRALVACAARDGLRCLEFVTGASISVSNDQVAGVSTPKGDIATPNVILAAGVWSNEPLRSIGAELPLFWHRAEVCCYRRPEGIGEHPIVGDFVNRFYFRPELGGLTLAGSIPRMDPGVSQPANLEGVEHPDRFREGVSTPTIQDLHTKLASRMPAISEGYWRRGHACVYDVTPDWHPILSLQEAAKGLYVAAGFSGHGFVMSPSVGRIIADAVAGHSGNVEERSLFRPQRFAENQPVAFEIG